MLPTETKGGFSLNPQSLDEAMKLAEMICNTEIVPKAFKGKAGDTLVAMMLGSELGLNPLYSLTNIAVINGRPSIWGDAMPALCQTNPEFISMDETFDDETMTATCIVKRKNHEPHIVTFSQDDAIKAGLWQTVAKVTRTNRSTGEQFETTNDSPWFKYPKRMLQMRARGFALRDKFSDSLHGLITREEARDLKDITDDSEEISREPIKENETETQSTVLPTYTDGQFETNFPNFEKLIKAGHKTASNIINMVESKYTLTGEQKKKIKEIK